MGLVKLEKSIQFIYYARRGFANLATDTS